MKRCWNKLDDDIKGQIAYLILFAICEIAIILPFILVGSLKGE